MEKSNLKICSFYVSDWHLTAMLLPYIEDTIERNEHLHTILENNISYNMKEILTRVKMDDRKKEEILKIDWESKRLLKYGETKKYLEKIVKYEDRITIIIDGSKDKIEYINKNIDRWMKKSEKKLIKKEIKIINCYEVSEFNSSLQEILDMHDKILNTSGIHEKEEMYAGYVKRQVI